MLTATAAHKDEFEVLVFIRWHNTAWLWSCYIYNLLFTIRQGENIKFNTIELKQFWYTILLWRLLSLVSCFPVYTYEWKSKYCSRFPELQNWIFAIYFWPKWWPLTKQAISHSASEVMWMNSFHIRMNAFPYRIYSFIMRTK